MAAQASIIDQVYHYICQYVTDNKALPSTSMVGAALGLDQIDVSACVEHLRRQGQIAPVTLLLTVYAGWWCDHVRPLEL